ncbi:2-dehydro-3-deoxy-6-phosphogalactonate aldolase [Vibrio penaeicida]|uniref:2-dehydro-3-deoxy-6-phosphogalactonate aldolase n=1 Tax=Vibrio penaeicida TaxID=104609 RepID=A0AAV5NPP3_9VIBR|nr:2-dehydro-3-deoxy-6-phosphogalactonate aldolase [Vibrio penaeicida]RTZ20801.1 2-dehydro-3-deoxy-6-phosphogalactonate aldolase [Vibrio penaeicida]GLQ72319.1 2-dehydro-3-deoxy-6-phosphogalactonate aldolase [Vibrio penaeicida]
MDSKQQATELTRHLSQCGLVAILRGITPTDVLQYAKILVDEGISIIEVPLNSPDAIKSISILANDLGNDCLIGAGTVLTTIDIDEVESVGGRLIVMPHMDTELIEYAASKNLVVVPGVATPSEAFSALKVGATALKLFPAEQVLAAGLRAWKAILPKHVKVLPVGGITPSNMSEYRQSGASGFGLGSALYRAGIPHSEFAKNAKEFVAEWHRLVRMTDLSR